jgi:hypothetical protein
MKKLLVLCALMSMFVVNYTCPVFAAWQEADNVTITYLSVNGAADTLNPGTTCMAVSAPVSSACPGGWIAIQNNNKQLLAAAFLANATKSQLKLTYQDFPGGSFHCPFLTFTPCSAESILLK